MPPPAQYNSGCNQHYGTTTGTTPKSAAQRYSPFSVLPSSLFRKLKNQLNIRSASSNAADRDVSLVGGAVLLLQVNTLLLFHLDKIMSAVESAVEADEVCANCGTTALDDVKLKKCACLLVQYCSIECRDDHLDEHEEECKKKMNEFHDKKLFSQPDISSRGGDCPICFLPLSLDSSKSVMKSCCSNLVCIGCDYAHRKISKTDEENAMSCPFCREPFAYSDEEHIKRAMKRVEAGDPAALTQMGTTRYKERDYDSAIEYLTKAAQSGDLEAHSQLGVMYEKGQGVENDKEKAVYHLEKAAIGGDPIARYNLGISRGKMVTWREQ